MSDESDDEPLRASPGSPRKRDEAQVKFMGLDARAREFDLDEVVAAGHIWYGHPDVAPHEILAQTPGGRRVLLVDVPLELAEDGSGSPMPSQVTDHDAAEWCALNRIGRWPDGLARVDLVVSDGPPGEDPAQPVATKSTDPHAEALGPGRQDTKGTESRTASPKQRGQRRSRPHDARVKIISALESLITNGEWGWNDTEIARRAGVKKTTAWRALNHDRAVRKAMAEYERQSCGRRPPRPRDL